MDSVVLLHLLVSVRQALACPIMAIHINHGLQAEADDWQAFVEGFCTALKVDCRCLTLTEKPESGDSVEAWAREQRYQAMQTVLNSEDLLLTAHHADDQTETVLLQLIRGAGPQGLAAMPMYSALDDYAIARPLLNVQRQQIMVYAQQQRLQWVEDTSNQNQNLDRNYLRHSVIPLLKQRWPNLNKTFLRAAAHQSEAIELLSEFAELELTNIIDDQKESIDIRKLLAYPVFKQKLILRYWIKQSGFRLPSEKVLNVILSDSLTLKSERLPVVRWSDCEIRRFRDRLYIMPKLSAFDASISYHWSISKPLKLAYGMLSAELVSGQGIRVDVMDSDSLFVRYRQGGEKIKPQHHRHHRLLKKLLQQASVLPWMRDKIPLLYNHEQLIAVPGLWLADNVSCKTTEPGWNIRWQCDRRLFA